MRPIKFRGWNEKEKKMYPLVVVDSDGSWSPSVVDDDWHSEGAEQFTGLTDKHGVEIFEGDLIRRTALGYSRIFPVVWSDTNARFMLDDLVVFPGTDDEVVGNIHETPELMNQ